MEASWRLAHRGDTSNGSVFSILGFKVAIACGLAI